MSPVSRLQLVTSRPSCILVPGNSILNILELTALVGLVSVAAGFLGALTGLGGGVVITPAMVLLLGIDLHYAMGATLISVIATSSGAAAAYVREGFSNIRIGMFLEIATAVGAVGGAFAAAKISPSILGVLFGVVLLHSAWISTRGRPAPRPGETDDPLATRLRLNGSFPTLDGLRSYKVSHVKTGFSLMFVAGGGFCRPGVGSGGLERWCLGRLRRIESRRHGPRHAHPVQGLHHHQQLHDWSDRGRQRRRLSQPRIHRPRTHHAGGAGRARRLDAGGAPVARRSHHDAAAGLRPGGRCPRRRDDL